MKLFKNTLLMIMNVFIILLVYLISNHSVLNVADLSWVAVFISLFLILTYFPLAKGDGISIAFLIVFSLVIFGRVFLQYGINYIPETSYFDSLKAYSHDGIKDGILLGIYSLVGLHTGMLFRRRKNRISPKIKNIIINSYNHNELVSLKITGVIIFFIAVIPSIINYIFQFRGIPIYGNANTLIGILSGLMLPVLIILMITKRSTSAFVLAVMYYFPQLLWGERGRPILQIAVILFVYLKHVNKKKIKFGEKMFVFLASILTLNLFVIIKEYRGYVNISWIKNLPSIFISTFTHANPILEIVYEVGLGIVPTVATINLVPNIIPIQYGKTIFYSITNAIPDIMSIRPDFMSTYGNITGLISDYMGASFGASMLQDFYVNFMWFTPLVMVFVGYLVYMFSLRVATETNIVKSVFLSMLIYPVLWWPRSSIGFIFRYSFVTIIIPILIYHFIKKILVRKSSKILVNRILVENKVQGEGGYFKNSNGTND